MEFGQSLLGQKPKKNNYKHRSLVHHTTGNPELEEEMSAVREDYLMDLFTNCQTCLDPISGEKLLVADLR